MGTSSPPTSSGVVSPKTQMILNDGWLEMRANRKKGGAARAFTRGWKYGEGKQVAIKVGAGVAVGVIFAGVSVATAGAALPVVLALAAGGFAAGQAANASISILKNRSSHRGLANTANWIDSLRGTTMQEQRDRAKALDTRAYKTIRRAYEHFREALRKAKSADAIRIELTQAGMVWVPCDFLLDLLSSSLSVSHHLHKARLYMEPCIHVQRVLLFALEAWIKEWGDAEKALSDRVDAFMKAHKESCGKDCYLGSTGAKKGVRDRPDEVVLWSASQIKDYDDKLADLFEALAVASVAPRPHANFGSGAVERTKRMMDDTYALWNTRRKAWDIRTKHFITNTFARKTKAERVAFGASQAVSAVAGVASTAGGIAVDAPVKALTETLLPGLDIGIAFGSVAADTARDIGAGLAIDAAADKVAPTPDVDDDTDLQHHRGGTAAATQNRDFVRKAAQHIYEADERRKRVNELGNLTITSCGHARELAAHVFAVNHHIGKAQQYLEQSMEIALETGRQISQASLDWTGRLNAVYMYVSKRVAFPDHRVCQGICYGAAPGQPSKPTRPFGKI